MDISRFDCLLRAERRLPEPRRRLFVLAAVEMPNDANDSLRARSDGGHGGVHGGCIPYDRLEQPVRFG